MDVLNLARLGHPVAFSLKPSFSIKADGLVGSIKVPRVHQETADQGARPPLAVVAVHHAHFAHRGQQVLQHDLADGEQHMELWSLVILPVEAPNVGEDGVVDGTAADVDDLVVLLVFFVEEFGDCIDGVAVEFLYSFGGVGHCDDPGSDIRQV